MRPLTELPIGSVLYHMLLVFPVLTYTISSVVATFYARRCIIDGDTTLPRFPWPTVFLIAPAIGNYLGSGQIWIVFLTLQLCVGVLSPIAVIATSYQLRGYVRGIFQDFQSAALFTKDFCAPYLTLRSPQVHPIQE